MYCEAFNKKVCTYSVQNNSTPDISIPLLAIDTATVIQICLF